MLIDKLRSDLILAMKSGDKVCVETLRFLLSAIKNFEIDKYPPTSSEVLSDEDIFSVIDKQVKTHKESIDMFKKANRNDLVEKETKQLRILEKYLPKQLGEEEIRKEVNSAKNRMQNQGREITFGSLMSEVMDSLRGKADGKVVSRIIHEEIG